MAQEQNTVTRPEDLKRDPKRLEEAIAHTREEMDETLEALSRKLSPKRAFRRIQDRWTERAKRWTEDAGRRLPSSDEVQHTIKEGADLASETTYRRPLEVAAGVLAVGILTGYLLGKPFRRRAAETPETFERVRVPEGMIHEDLARPTHPGFPARFG